jgi:hypothetical protein
LSITPTQIIEAFDECLEYVYGRSYGRDNPHKSDDETALRWIDAGLTLHVACFVFYRQMNIMHELWTRDNLRDRSHIPHSLKVFDENIEAGIRRHKGGGDWSASDMVDSLWRARLRVWTESPSWWNHDMWGPPPGTPGCRAPRAVIAEAFA